LFVTKSASRKYSVKRPRAAALIIGDEILNGTVADVNTTELAKFLFARGIEFDKVEIVPDKVSMTIIIYKYIIGDVFNILYASINSWRFIDNFFIFDLVKSRVPASYYALLILFH
jgi:hypothetical protein